MALRLGDGHGIGNLERKLKSLPLAWLPCILRPKQYPGYQYLSAAVISAEDFAPQKPLFDLQDQKLGTITETTDLVQIAGEHDDAVFFQMQFMRRDSRRIQGVEVVSLKPVLNIFVHGAICAINDGRILVKLRQAPLVDVIYISIRAGENDTLGSLLVVAICDGEISENFLNELLDGRCSWREEASHIHRRPPVQVGPYGGRRRCIPAGLGNLQEAPISLAR